MAAQPEKTLSGVDQADHMDQRRFEKLVEDALDRMPRFFRDKLSNVAIIVEDLPPRDPEPGTLLLGLFHGVPMTQKSTFFATPPDHIFLYQKNIEAVCRSDEEIRRQVRDTLLHEVGHYFGMTEDDLSGI
jgi:predicted Zn-dependent protease with MMP-like domain